MEKNTIIVLVVIIVAIIGGLFGGKILLDYIDSDAKNSTVDNDRKYNSSNKEVEIDVEAEAKKIFNNEMSSENYIVSYNINDFELFNSAGNIYVFKINYDFTYNENYFGADRLADTDTIKNKEMYYAFKKDNNELKLIETGTGGSGKYAENFLAKQAFINYLQNLEEVKVTDYRIKTVSYEKTIDNDLIFYVMFSVQSDPMMDAGNGNIANDNWVNDKEVYITIKKENEQYIITNVATSKPLD